MNSQGDILELDPFGDRRWLSFVNLHARATVFHGLPWLEALRQTYGYRSLAFARVSSSGDILGGVLFCEIKSWMTGSRLVSLPFSDHCEPLVASPEELRSLMAYASERRAERSWRYLEIRPLSAEYLNGEGEPYAKFVYHRLDLRPTTGDLFRKLHVDSI